MAPTTSVCSSGESFSSSFASSSRNDLENGKAEEESQKSAGVREDTDKQKQPSSTQDQIVDYETILAQLEDLNKKFDYETYLALFKDFNRKEEERLRKKSKAKAEAEDHGQKQGLNQTKRPSIRCAKCNKNFETAEERINHIKTSPMHYACRRCVGIVEFTDFTGLCLHYKHHHPLLHSYSCVHHFATAEEHRVHVKNSPHHFCCQICDGAVEFQNTCSLHLHYRCHHPLLYCQLCDRPFPTLDKSFAHMQDCHNYCDGCHVYFSSPGILQTHRVTCGKANTPKKKEAPRPRERKANAETPRSHYVTLGISPDSSQEQIIKAAKEVRIKTHPDRLKRQGGLTEEQERKVDVEAALVGQAADILSNPELRRKYDMRLRA